MTSIPPAPTDDPLTSTSVPPEETPIPTDDASTSDIEVPPTTTPDPTPVPEPTTEPEPEPIPTTTTTTTTTPEEIPPTTTTTTTIPEETPTTTTTTTTPIPEETTTSTTPEPEPEPTTLITTTSTTSSEEEIPETTSTTSSDPPPESSSTTVVIVTSTTPGNSPSETTTSSSSAPTPIDPSESNTTGLDQGAKVAIGVAVPIGAIAIIAVLFLFWWKKRRARLYAEEERRKEVEDYSYNPNADPTIPVVGMTGSENAYDMREDGSSGYRGWGTTVAGSTGRKASTTMSGGVGNAAYSDATTPTRVNMSDGKSPPMYNDVPVGEGEILGAMGPSAANNRTGDVRRGPSNASSSYSATGRSEGSDGIGGPSYSQGGTYYDQVNENPYGDGARAQEIGGQAVIRDNPARRNTRIENPSHYPQQSAGISQNF